MNEHTFVIPENLLCFLRRHFPLHQQAAADGQTQEQRSSARLLGEMTEEGADRPLFLGHRLTLEDGTAFLSGACACACVDTVRTNSLAPDQPLKPPNKSTTNR